MKAQWTLCRDIVTFVQTRFETQDNSDRKAIAQSLASRIEYWKMFMLAAMKAMCLIAT